MNVSRIPTEFREAHALGFNNQDIAALFDISVSTVKRYKQALGLGSTDDRNNLGRLGEQLVADALTQQGMTVQTMPEGHPYDLMADGRRLEVKTSASSEEGRYRFRLNTRRSSNHAHYRYEKDFQQDSDFLVLVMVQEGCLEHLYYIPTAHCPPNLLVQPASPFCPYAPYRNAWPLLRAQALAA